MATYIPYVDGVDNISNAEFVRLEVPGGPGTGIYTFSNSYKPETINSEGFAVEFEALGALVGVSGHQRDLSVTSYDTSITLVGIDKTKIGLVIDAGLKGGKVQIWRGFYDENMVLEGDPVLRYTGIVTGYSIQEERQDRTDFFSLVLHCSSFKKVLENRVAGRFTSASSWKNLNPSDVAMDNVSGLHLAQFNFGQKL